MCRVGILYTIKYEVVYLIDCVHVSPVSKLYHVIVVFTYVCRCTTCNVSPISKFFIISCVTSERYYNNTCIYMYLCFNTTEG